MCRILLWTATAQAWLSFCKRIEFTPTKFELSNFGVINFWKTVLGRDVQGLDNVVSDYWRGVV